MSKLTRRGLVAAACAAPLAAGAPSLFAQDADRRPAVFIIGDSIIRNGYNDNGGVNDQWGWGHIMKWRFDPRRIHVVNDAMGGTSSRSFMESPSLWPRVKQMIRPGDFVLIGFGHNDPAGSLRGNGDETGTLTISGASADLRDRVEPIRFGRPERRLAQPCRRYKCAAVGRDRDIGIAEQIASDRNSSAGRGVEPPQLVRRSAPVA